MEKLKSIFDRIFSAEIFKVLIVVITMAISVPFVHMAIGSYVKLVLAYGFAVICWGLLRKNYRNFIKDKLNWLLMAFAASYFVTILINREMNFTENIKDFAYMVVFFVLLYMRGSDKPIRSVQREVEIVSAVVIACTFILSAVSFAMYILLIEGHYMTENGFMYYGMYEHRLWGVYNANTGSTLNGISILLSTGFIAAHRKSKTAVILNSINIFLQFCCLILTGSRAALYTIILLIGILAFVITARILMNKRYEKGEQRTRGAFMRGALISTCAAAVAVFVCIGVTSAAKLGLSYLPGIASDIRDMISDVPDVPGETPGERYDFERFEETENREGGFFNGRVDIWDACLKGLRGDIIFGVSRENIFDKASVYLNGSTWMDHFKVGGTHNIYICILVASGALGLIIFMEFIIFALIRAFRSIASNLRTVNFWLITVFLIVIFFCITETVEARILYQVNVFYALFWIYCGYMTAFAVKTRESRGGDLIA